ncbi:MAG TPA: hypothetical protein VEA80_14560 [Vitreimonas sp.]|uniref:hypothetical protein n=1 Tax=Vitreimonas sp. TaxID=3069702 RepID=UPI002D723C84|nr:hypothetical protein [Vitreimonas sp.]HYD88693.1 hypothetical protein [Vitreimonas sp.]
MLKWLLISAALYMALVGAGLMFFTPQFGVGAVPADASSELLALMRLLGGPFFGIAALNWLTRNAEPSKTRDAVLLANLVGFAAVALNDAYGVLTGEARDVAKLFLVVHAAFALAFLAAWLRARRAA